MPLDPGAKLVLDLIAGAGRTGMADGTVDEARALLRLVTFDILQPAQVIPVASVKEINLPGEGGSVAGRVYRPEIAAGQACPTVLFVHGGGFVLGDLDTHDNQARRLCRDTSSVVVTLDYRRAPEAPWPAGRDDCVAAMHWISGHVGDLGGDPERLAVAGDSAGGNLAALVALACRGDDAPRLCAQLLLYPSTSFVDDDATFPSRVSNGEGYFLTRDDMEWFNQQYLPDGSNPRDPRLSPLFAEVGGVAPAVVVTSEYDPLRDEGNAYARLLQEVGVHVDHWVAPGMIHGFFDMWRASEGVEAACAKVTARFRAMLWSD